MLNLKVKEINFNDDRFKGKVLLRKRKRGIKLLQSLSLTCSKGKAGAIYLDKDFSDVIKDFVKKKKRHDEDYLFKS